MVSTKITNNYGLSNIIIPISVNMVSGEVYYQMLRVVKRGADDYFHFLRGFDE